MDWQFLAQLVAVLFVIAMGARKGGISLGLWGGVGVFILVVLFGETPSAPPIDVMLIILAVISAAAVMEAAGGIAFLVGVAEKIIRRFPQQVTFVAPVVAYLFTFGAGTGHVFYPLLPVIHDVAHSNGIRPERPIAVSTIASQQAITASPVSAAMAALIVVLEANDFSMAKIMAIAIPATLGGVLIAATLSFKWGKELADDPEFQRRVREGLVEPIPERLAKAGVDTTKTAVADAEKANEARPGSGKISALLFLVAVASIIVLGAFENLRPTIPGEDGADPAPLSMALTIEITMLAVSAIMLLITQVKVDSVPRTDTAHSGFVALVGIFGLAWLGQTLIDANEETVIGALSDMATAAPWTFAIGLFFASVLLFSQAATTKALMPLGLSLGIGAPQLAAMWPAVNGYFFLPTYGTIIAAINFDRSGTTKIGKFVLNHSFMIPGLVATISSVAIGLGIAAFF